ncbi:MAG: hypothetical protein RR185_07250 [Angelakisella sp.]
MACWRANDREIRILWRHLNAPHTEELLLTGDAAGNTLQLRLLCQEELLAKGMTTLSGKRQ